MRQTQLTLGRLAIFLIFGVGVWIGGGRGAQAAEPAKKNKAEPVAVLCGASYDRWHQNVELVGTLSGCPDLAQGLEAMLNIATANQGLVGLDKTRPWAAIVAPNGPAVMAYACLPVDRLGALLKVVRPLVRDIVPHDRSQEIIFRDGTTIHVAGRNGWVVVALDAATVDRATADPMSAVGDLAARYDLGLRIYVARIPRAIRPILFAAVASQNNERSTGMGDSDDVQCMVREALRLGLDQLDRLTVGLKFNHDIPRMAAELTLVAKRGTLLAERWAQFHANNAHPAGFALPEATVAASWAGPLPPKVTVAINTWLDQIEQKIADQLDQNQGALVETEQVQSTKATLTDVLHHLPVDLPRFEATTSLVLKPSQLTWIAAMRVPEGHVFRKKIEAYLADVGHDDKTTIRTEQATDRDGPLLLHVLSFPLHAPADKTFAPLTGQKLETVVGLGKEYFYVSMGRGALASLQKALATARSQPPVLKSPITCMVALRPLAATVAMQSDQGAMRIDARRIAEVLEKDSAYKDAVHFTAEPVAQGVRYRVELDEGVLKVVSLILGTVGVDRKNLESMPKK